MDSEELFEVLHEIFRCGLESSVKCEMCEEDFSNSGVEELSLCLYGKLDKNAVNCIQSVVEKHNLKYMWIKGEGKKILKLYTPKERMV